MTLKTRLDRLTRRLSDGGPCYAIPETVDVRALTPAQAAATIPAAEERAAGKTYRGVKLVIIDCEEAPCQNH
jgi:hypothetical protein